MFKGSRVQEFGSPAKRKLADMFLQLKTVHTAHAVVRWVSQHLPISTRGHLSLKSCTLPRFAGMSTHDCRVAIKFIEQKVVQVALAISLLDGFLMFFCVTSLLHYIAFL